MEQRIEKLERQCRLYRNLFILAGLAVVALVTWGATKPIPDVIQARKFEVVNKDGVRVAVLTAWELGGRFDIWEKHPQLVKIVRRLYRRNPISKKRASLRSISRELMEMGYMTQRGRMYGTNLIKNLM